MRQNRSASDCLVGLLEQNRRRKPVGVYSICSANRFVLEAGMLQAHRDNCLLLIESTSNQVNQFGGYTGQTPVQFVASVKGIAAAMSFPSERIVFGGDHLGPHVWRNESASSAIEKAGDLVRACVLAGYAKIHLDASMRLAGDPGDPAEPLGDEIVSSRAAEMCRIAEDAHAHLTPGSPAPVYVIGTEVPIPGGELLHSADPKPSRPVDVASTIQAAEQAFKARGLEAAWKRVIAVVVQPGVEFSGERVFPYKPENGRELSRFAEENWHGVYEAHSTDYQMPEALRQMVVDHFAILKVGPALTFAFREAVFALAAMEEEWLGDRSEVTLSRIRESLEEAMVENPEHWKGYYRGDDLQLHFARKYNLSDRCRYYWPQPKVAAALQRLLANLTMHPVPLSLVSQYLPNQHAALRDGIISNQPAELIRSKILEVIDQYAQACGMKSTSQ
jgi:D-tagatose-1,6-bisphosphate aldolase subunit GatZ/KbaZ